jgi:hypothetical protein
VLLKAAHDDKAKSLETQKVFYTNKLKAAEQKNLRFVENAEQQLERIFSAGKFSKEQVCKMRKEF